MGSNSLTKILKLDYKVISSLKTKQLFRFYSTTNENTENVPKHYDIIIAGGGLVGTTLASAISKNTTLKNKDVLLLEGAPKFKGFNLNGEYSNRVSALNRSTIELMKEINAFESIKKCRFKQVKQMQVWDACSNALITFNHENFQSDVAYIVENDLILDAVYKELENAENIEIKNESKIESVLLPKDKVKKSTVKLRDGKVFTCDLLIGADGGNSLVRKQMNVDYYTVNYNQMGLVATLELIEPEDNTTAWQRFLPTGPIALLPLNESKSSLVWTTTPKHAKKLLSVPPKEFVDELNEAFVKEYPQSSFVQNTFGLIESVLGSNNAIRQYPPQVKNVIDNSRACFPLGFGHASSYVCEGAALIGDAAHRIHPLAGQGVNLGFGDVKCLVRVLSDAVYCGFRLGDKTHLFKYEKERLIQNVPIMFGVHGLQTLYSTTFSPIVLLRSLGLQITHNLPPLKKIFMEKAMG